MRPIGLIIATALLAILGGVVWWTNKKQPEAEKAESGSATASKILTLSQADIVKVEAKRREGETTRIERSPSGEWKVTSPEPFPVDKDAVNSLLSAVSSVTGDKVVEEKPTDLAPFGLTQPATQVVVTLKDGKSRTIKLGDEAPVGGGTFAQVEGDSRVFVLASFSRGNIDKLAVDLRDKRLLTFDQDKLTRLEFAGKGAPIEFSRNAENQWALIKPKPLRADNWQVEDLLRRIKELKLDPLLTSDQKADLQKQFNISAPLATVTVTDNSGTQKLEVRKNKDNKYYAKSSVVEGFHLVPDDAGKSFEKPAEDYRNKKLFDFGFNDPTRVEFKDASRQLALSKSGDKWLANMKPMDPVGVQSLIDRLRDLSATKFPETGFTTPSIELSVATKDSKNPEKISISKSGDKYIARREGEPALYEIESKSVDDLVKAAADVKEAPAAPAAGGTKK